MIFISESKPVSVLVSALMALNVLLAGCSNQPESTQEKPAAIKPVPLSAFKGEKITFEMCGSAVEMPRKYVGGIRSNEQFGVLPTGVKHIDGGWSKRRADETVELAGSFSIGCTTTNVESTNYQKVLFKGRPKILDVGLAEYLRGPDQYGEMTAEYEEVNYEPNTAPFVMDCSWRNSMATPRVCIVRGIRHPNFGIHLTVTSGDPRQSWRGFKEIFENIIRIEKEK